MYKAHRSVSPTDAICEISVTSCDAFLSVTRCCPSSSKPVEDCLFFNRSNEGLLTGTSSDSRTDAKLLRAPAQISKSFVLRQRTCHTVFPESKTSALRFLLRPEVASAGDMEEGEGVDQVIMRQFEILGS